MASCKNSTTGSRLLEIPADADVAVKESPYLDQWAHERAHSLPGTPRRASGSSRECASETEARIAGARRRRRWIGDRMLSRAFSGAFFAGGDCRVVVRPRGNSGRRICMDMEEVKACRDLGLQIPRDFTVEIPGGLSGNGGDSPVSRSGEDADEIKAKLRIWAQAVAFVSSAARSGR